MFVAYLRCQYTWVSCTFVCHAAPWPPLGIHLLHPRNLHWLCFAGALLTIKWLLGDASLKACCVYSELIRTSHSDSNEEHAGTHSRAPESMVSQ